MSEIECKAIFAELKNSKVVVLEGSRAFPNAEHNNQNYSFRYFRLSFSYLSRECIAEGIKRIALVIQGYSK
jgi:DNA-binding transcriptional MocR family regulator